ncbi:MAG: hypothetical protein ACRCXT_19010, partial [Paraclostridium sp.]
KKSLNQNNKNHHFRWNVFNKLLEITGNFTLSIWYRYDQQPAFYFFFLSVTFSSSSFVSSIFSSSTFGSSITASLEGFAAGLI